MKIKTRTLAVLLPLIAIMVVPLLAAERVVRSGSPFEPSGMDPAQAWDDISAFYVDNIFDTLVRLNPQTTKIEPALAVSWETSPDGRTWTFQLRRGVRFHDGTPLDADAVVFTFFRQMDPANPNRQRDFPMFSGIFTLLKAVQKLDAQRVQFILSEPFFPFLAALTVECAAIVSPTAVKKEGANFAHRPVGTGPFKLDSWQKDKRLVLTANREYWGVRPSVDEYVNIIEPSSEILNSYFQQGTLDILYSYSISKMVSYKKQDWVKVVAAPYLSVTFVVINAARPTLSRKRVRQALGCAWDPRALKLIFQDYVLPIHTLLPKGLIASETEAPGSEFSLAKAQNLLKKESMEREIQLEMLLQKDDGLLFQLFSMFARNLKQIGIKLKLTRLDAQAYKSRIALGDYDLAYSGWIADYPDPDSMLFPLLSEQLQKQGFANIAGAKRRDLDDLLKAARRERDAKKRQALYRDIDRAIVDDGLVIPLYQDKRVMIYNQKIGRLQPDLLGKFYLNDLQLK
ncbi:MAG: ABC transporter substrate-binding protein [Candidatus Aminicenantes bacterium]|nr:ABC transporter substrate-binding protein [Candidatus Aminicenantes bacterium]